MIEIEQKLISVAKDEYVSTGIYPLGDLSGLIAELGALSSIRAWKAREERRAEKRAQKRRLKRFIAFAKKQRERIEAEF